MEYMDDHDVLMVIINEMIYPNVQDGNNDIQLLNMELLKERN